jgi:hypothetical protein
MRPSLPVADLSRGGVVLVRVLRAGDVALHLSGAGNLTHPVKSIPGNAMAGVSFSDTGKALQTSPEQDIPLPSSLLTHGSEMVGDCRQPALTATYLRRSIPM